MKKIFIKSYAKSFLNPPIKNLGIKGIRHFAKQVIRWHDTIRGTVYDPYQFKTEVSVLKLICFSPTFSLKKLGREGGL